MSDLAALILAFAIAGAGYAIGAGYAHLGRAISSAIADLSHALRQIK